MKCAPHPFRLEAAAARILAVLDLAMAFGRLVGRTGLNWFAKILYRIIVQEFFQR
jgi:hypothetical protein